MVNISNQEATWLPGYVQDKLKSNLSEYLGLTTVADPKVEATLKKLQKESESSARDENTALQLGKLTTAKYVLFVKIRKVGNGYAMSTDFTDCTTGEQLASATSKVYKKVEDLYSIAGAIDELTIAIANKLNIELSDTDISILRTGSADFAGRLGGGKITLWAFTDELETMVNTYYKPTHPKMDVDIKMFNTNEMVSKLENAFANGNSVPDVFTLEDAFVRKIIEKGDSQLLDLTNVYEEVSEKMIKYPSEIGTYQNKVYGLSWQVTPGAIFYRRSLAKKYLGTDDPVLVQACLSNWNEFNKTAMTLKEKSEGKCVILSSPHSAYRVYKDNRKQPWVVKGKLNIDPAIKEFMKNTKALKENGCIADAGQWNDQWFAGMRGDLKDYNGNNIEVFSYFLPTWGLHYVLKTNAPTTFGDWAVVPGPASYHWGGTWVAAYKNTKHPEEVKEFIKYITSDDVFLEMYAKTTGDVVSNNTVIAKIKDNFSEKFLNGQNHYEVFADLANKINGTLIQDTDQAIDNIFMDVYANEYIYGKKNGPQTLDIFKKRVKAELGIN
ncbi:MAG: extracellular solute-binding protein [Spirochaetales bacterium]|nr:extracellular solute-binding protein [Spirochaetales bacterium]